MSQGGETDPDYVLGTSEAEHQRLKAQSELVDPFTERIFREAGIEPGMHVLDVGCGAGDVSLLVGRMVGATGQVLGADREAASLETARRRVGELGITNIEFVESDFRELDAEYGVFDALVGRLVLMYQADPAEALRRAAEHVRPGGVIAFHEHELSVPMIARPPQPLREQVCGWLWETFHRSNAETGMGFGLYSIFEAAGFRSPEIRAEAIIDTPVTSYYWALMTRVMLPTIVELDVATEKEIDIETLDERLNREIIETGGVAIAFLAFGGWTHRPADLARGSTAP